MSERCFGKLDAVRQSMTILARCAGVVIKGEAVLVPVERNVYASRIERLLQADAPGYGGPDRIIEMALDRAPLSIGDMQLTEQHYKLQPGTLWDNMWSANRAAETASSDIVPTT